MLADSIRTAIAAGLWLAAVPGAGVAQPGNVIEAPPVDSLVARALEFAPSIGARRARAAALHLRAAAAGALADPTIEFGLEDVAFPRWTVGSNEMSTLGVELRQELGGFGRRGAERQAVTQEARVLDIDVMDEARRVSLAVRTQYARLYALDAEHRSLDAARGVALLLRDSGTARYGTGEAAMEPQLRAQLALSRVDAELEDLAAERAAASADLNRWLGRDPGASFGTFAHLPDVQVAADVPAQAVTASVALGRQRAAIAAAEAEAHVQRQNGRPNVFVGAGYANRGGFDPVIGLRIGAELPVWRRAKQGPAVGAADAEVEAARLELVDMENDVRAQAVRLGAQWQRDDAQVHRYREAIVPEAESALEVARSTYGAGRGDFATVLEDLETSIAARRALFQREAQRFMTWAEIEALVHPPAPAGQAAHPGGWR
jgi:outer membrane protein TolC